MSSLCAKLTAGHLKVCLSAASLILPNAVPNPSYTKGAHSPCRTQRSLPDWRCCYGSRSITQLLLPVPLIAVSLLSGNIVGWNVLTYRWRACRQAEHYHEQPPCPAVLHIDVPGSIWESDKLEIKAGIQRSRLYPCFILLIANEQRRRTRSCLALAIRKRSTERCYGNAVYIPQYSHIRIIRVGTASRR